MKKAWANVLRWLLPWACAGCRIPLETAEDAGFCGSCELALPRLGRWVCDLCGVPLKEGDIRCYGCRERSASLLIRAAVAYRGPVPFAIHRFKYAGRRSLAGPFSNLMVYAWKQYPELQPIDFLVPIPLHKASARIRGYNQAEELAQALSGRLRKPVVRDLLIRRRRTRPQFQLNRQQRGENMEGAFHAAVSPLLKNKQVLLIDDVCTTGATLIAATKALREAGIRTVKALVFARD